MIYCPQKNSKEWRQHVEALGEDLAYLIWHKNNGNSLDLTPKGKSSKLYNDILNKNNSDVIATIKEKANYYLENNNSWLESGVEPILEGKDVNKNTSTYRDITGKSFEDQLIPNVITENDDIRPSYLFKTLFDYTTKDVVEQVYLSTKSDEFKSWLNIKEKKQILEKETKKGINSIFKENPELGTIGSIEDYEKYLDTIFPETIFKDIYQHSSLVNLKKIGFKKGFGKTSDAFWFDNLGKSEYYGNYKVQVLLNARNQFDRYINTDIYIDAKYGNNTTKNILDHISNPYEIELINRDAYNEFMNYEAEEHPDSESSQFIKRDRIEELQKYGNFDSINGQGYVGIFEPEQIHILGSEQDINMFKNYINNQQFNNPNIDDSGEPLITIQNDIPVFTNINGETRVILEENNLHQGLLTVSSIINLIQDKNVEQIDKLNADYINNYYLKQPLIEYVDGKYIVNQEILNQINEQKLYPVYAAPLDDNNHLFNTQKLIVQKKNISSYYTNRINKYLKEAKLSDDPVEINRLNKEVRKLNDQLHGNDVIKGVLEEIEELKKITEPKNITDYIQRDIDRLEVLSNSLSEDELMEALGIADYYSKLGEINDNPIFTPTQITEIYNSKNTQLKEFIISVKDKANSARTNINFVLGNNLVKKLNDLPKIKSVYGEEGLTLDLLTEAIKDSNVIQSYFLSAARDQNVIPQIALYLLRITSSDHISIVEEDTTKLTELIPDVEKKLKELGETFKGVPSYKKLYQKNEIGGFTDRLISRYSSFYDNALETRLYRYRDNIRQVHALASTDRKQKSILIQEEKQNLLEWYKNNTEVFDIRKSQEMREFIANDELLSSLIKIDDTTLLNNNDLGITKKHYNEIIEKQKELLTKYKERYEAKLLTLLESEGIDDYIKLSEDGQKSLMFWIYEHSPLDGIQNFDSKYSQKIYSDFDHNILIPRKNHLKTRKNTNYYDEEFDFIEKEDVLYNFVQVAKDIVEFMRSTLPEDRFNTLIANCLPMHQHNTTEAFVNIGMWGAKNKLTDDLMDSITTFVDEDGNPISSLTGKTGLIDYKVNSSFLNEGKAEIQNIFNIEALKLQANLRKETNVLGYKNVDQRTTIPETFIKGEVLKQLANLINCKPTIDDIKRVMKLESNDNYIPVGRILKMYAINNVFEQKSFNLPKTLLYFARITAEYNARTEILPTLNYLMYTHQNVKTLDGKDRVHAVEAAQQWLENKGKGKYAHREFGISKKKFYSVEDKKLIKEIDEKLKDKELPEDIKSALIVQKNKLGKAFAWSQMMLFLTKAIRFKALGLNPLSEYNNFIQGRSVNWQIASSGDYFTYQSYIKAERIYDIRRHKKKLNILMERYDYLQDGINEYQEISNKTDFSLTKIGKYIKPFALRKATESAIQTPTMLAFLYDTIIKDDKGNSSNVFDAMDDEGKLKKEFRSKENIENWELNRGEGYKDFKSKSVAFAKKYGDYDTLSNLMYRSDPAASAGGLFKSWLPETMYRYWGPEHINLEAGITEKGIMRSNTPISAALQGFSVGSIASGLGGGLFSGSVGYLIAATKGDVSSNISAVEELVIHGKVLLQKALGSPINKIMGKEVIKQEANTLYENMGLTQLDAHNLSEVMSNITMQLYMITLGLTIKGLFWDWDKEKDKKRRMIYNLLMNRLTSISNETQTYTDPYAFWKTLSDYNPMMELLKDTTDLVKAVGTFIEGNDTYLNGQYRGQSRLMRSTSKLLTPSFAKGISSGIPFNLKSTSEREFLPNQSLGTKFLEDLKTPESVKKKRERLKNRTKAIEELEKDNPDITRKNLQKQLDKLFPN